MIRITNHFSRVKVSLLFQQLDSRVLRVDDLDLADKVCESPVSCFGRIKAVKLIVLLHFNGLEGFFEVKQLILFVPVPDFADSIYAVVA